MTQDLGEGSGVPWILGGGQGGPQNLGKGLCTSLVLAGFVGGSGRGSRGARGGRRRRGLLLSLGDLGHRGEDACGQYGPVRTSTGQYRPV